MQNSDKVLTASQIRELVKEHYKPRVCLIELAKAKKEAEEKQAEKPKQAQAMKQIPLEVMKLVLIVILVAYRSVSEYYDLISLNYREGNDAKKEAMKLNLLIQHEWHSGQRGGKTVLLEPTNEAFARFRFPPQYQNPGFLHCFLTKKVEEAMAGREYRVSVEKLVKNKSIDVVLERGKELIAVEIAVSDAHESENLVKDLRAGADKVFIVCLDNKVLADVKKKIQSTFDNDILSKVTVSNLAEFIDKHN